MAEQEIRIMVESIGELRRWLEKHHQNGESVWLVTWKKGKGHGYLSYDEIVDELICFGWVDSLPRKLDDRRTMRRISPRNPKSNWSKVNKARVQRLERAGSMRPSGRKVIETAKENGAWTFLDDVEYLRAPPDLAEALFKVEKASYYFERFPKSSKRSILEWIKTAKQPATRQRRIQETVHRASQNIKANHPKGRDQGPRDS